ncbi:MAG: acyl-CoA dehydrogenase [Acidimicrobiia bacterium]
MSASDPRDDEPYVAELRGWLAQHWDPDVSVDEWWQRVGDAGWTAPHFPTEWGGRGLSRRAQTTVRAEFRRHGALQPPGGLGLLMAAPTILTHGTPEQVARHVPGVMNGSVAWCQLFSEPGAGSDLAGLGTRAVREGEKWRVTGQKVWSSYAAECDYGMLIARTDVDAPKHAGISWFALRLDQPGVTVRPLRESTGFAHFNEVFLDGAEVDHADLIGGESQGWAVTQTTLLFERAGIGAGGGMAGFPPPGRKGGFLGLPAGDAARIAPPGATQKVLSADELLTLARERGRAGDPHVRQALARLVAHTRTGAWTAARARAAAGAAGTGLANLGKLAQTRILKGSANLALEILGADGMLWAPDGPVEGRYSEAMVFSTASSIYGGTDEIQRNVVGERALGLPREPSVDRGVPFRDIPRDLRGDGAPHHPHRQEGTR